VPSISLTMQQLVRSLDNGINVDRRSPPADSDGSPLHRRSPKEYSGSPPGSRSRSADDSPVASD
jgi:FUS-interacting serine-arginine-rich protein 1